MTTTQALTEKRAKLADMANKLDSIGETLIAGYYRNELRHLDTLIQYYKDQAIWEKV